MFPSKGSVMSRSLLHPIRLFAKGDISFFLKSSLGVSDESEGSVVSLTSKIHTMLPKNFSYCGPCCRNEIRIGVFVGYAVRGKQKLPIVVLVMLVVYVLLSAVVFAGNCPSGAAS